MYKIFEIVCLGAIGLLYGGVLTVSYLMSMIYLLITEIIGTKKFMRKFKKLNRFIFDEFKDTLKEFKSIFELV
jgi:hypothetical protein